EVKVPDIGDFDSVEVIEVLVAEGDTVEKEQPLITLESDKATLEVPSTAAGRITGLKVAEGSTVSEGDVIALLESSGGGQSSGAKSQPQSGGDRQAAGSSQSKSGSDRAQKQRDDKSSEEPSTPRSGTAHKDDEPHDAGRRGGDPSQLKSVDEDRFGKAHASPSVRKYARELGADLGRIEGSGHKGRITFEDVQSYVKGALDQVQSG
ncbi:biotin/lipoyl-containing protein, partial [Salinisphaera sp. SWV1]|uniref:biotin/lipoyl-containing protein n=1 Tax=Salinisphaera sp. SWV1 TaxID=3454139 RepID=UPI003F87502B